MDKPSLLVNGFLFASSETMFDVLVNTNYKIVGYGEFVRGKLLLRRARIRLQIAKAISDILPDGHKLSYTNVRRHVTRDWLTNYNIRRDTSIHSTDWLIAINVVREERIARGGDRSYSQQSSLEDRLKKSLQSLYSQELNF